MSERPSEQKSLNDLDARIKAFEAKRQRKPGFMADKIAGGGYRVLGELIGGVLAGLGFGWLVDEWLKTKPLGLILGLFIGLGTAVYMIVRSVSPSPSTRVSSDLDPKNPSDEL